MNYKSIIKIFQRLKYKVNMGMLTLSKKIIACVSLLFINSDIKGIVLLSIYYINKSFFNKYYITYFY